MVGRFVGSALALRYYLELIEGYVCLMGRVARFDGRMVGWLVGWCRWCLVLFILEYAQICEERFAFSAPVFAKRIFCFYNEI